MANMETSVGIWRPISQGKSRPVSWQDVSLPSVQVIGASLDILWTVCNDCSGWEWRFGQVKSLLPYRTETVHTSPVSKMEARFL